MNIVKTTKLGVDPGFLVGDAAYPLGWGAPTYNFPKIYKKLHEIRNISGRAKGEGLGAPLDPPLRTVVSGIPSLYTIKYKKINFFFCNVGVY